ncbi:flagellar hook assembly protein FlgD [Aliagarivorans marinus]|uniref:flagellar hook assembly protein FlgD n=1 Tax=Aliagarivorans marinus TaxID=561965 RepID=UPI0003F5769B|nr:flagellar hook assembly protein FlgD [Aliagarivorans marinus]
MSTVSPLQNSGLYWEPESIVPEQQSQQLDQEDFFSLLTTQLQYQDPSKPVDNAEMIAQMSSFQTSEGIVELGKKMDDLNSIMNSQAALQASTLVGQQVLVPLDYGYSDGTGFSGVAVASSDASNVSVTVENSVGETVATIPMEGGAGNLKFEWDGTLADGSAAPAGIYNVTVSATQGGKQTSLPTATYADVGSVSLGSSTSGVVVNLNGLGGISMNDVLEVAKG